MGFLRKINLSGNKWAIFLWINLLWLLGTLALGFISYNNKPPIHSNREIETIKIVFLSLGGLGVILPTYLNAFNTLEQVDAHRVENSYSLLEKWDNPHLFKAREFTRDLKNQKKNLSDTDLLRKIDADESLKQSIILIMNYFDGIRVSINHNRIKTEIIKDTLGPVFADIYQRLLPYVDSLPNKDYRKDWDALYDLLK